MFRARRRPRTVTGNPSFIPKKTPLAIFVGLALSGQAPAAGAEIYNVSINDASGTGSFAEAITLANADGITDIINILATGEIILPDGLAITNPLHIYGPGKELLTITIDNNCESGCSDLFRIAHGNDTVSFNNLTLDAGNALYTQNLIEHNNGGELTVNNCALINSGGRITLGSGGAIINLNGNLTIQNTRITGQHAGDGGAIYNTNGNLVIQDSIISDNHASGGGGAIYFHGANAGLQIQNTTISNNDAEAEGGGIYVFDVLNVSIENSTISANSGGGDGGGGIYFSPVDLAPAPAPILLTIKNSTFAGNSGSNGGGLYVGLDGSEQANVTITNSVFSGNHAQTGIGGGVAARSFGDDTLLNFEVHNTLFGENTALERGGGLGVEGSVMNTFINNSSIISNTVYESTSTDMGGGGLYILGDQMSLTMINTTVDGNLNMGAAPSPSGGGGLFLSSFGYGLTACLLNVTITNNSSSAVTGKGGGIVTDFDTGNNRLRLINSIVAGNDAATGPDILSEDTEISYSLIGNDSGAHLTDLSMGHNIVGTGGAPADPMLAAIADNGGIRVGVAGDVPLPTRRVRRGSPVISAADEASSDFTVMSPPTTDQRGDGFDRIRGNGMEMGAIEYIAVPRDDNDDDNDDSDNGGEGGGGGGAVDFALLLSLSGLVSLRRRRN
ncbi:MAG TPA: right-handed parallel beta-helix repeat-containing protein [Gammaproteobacteria bacterium]|nr:right-handed parallel beta-helix repeat-containing protein [Gammaproteobacteria bacterium]